jgi:hypothetical protein
MQKKEKEMANKLEQTCRVCGFEGPVAWTAEDTYDLEQINALLNTWDMEQAPQTLEEVGDYPDPPEDRYDRWEP